MKLLLAFLMLVPFTTSAQTPTPATPTAPDDRYKADLLLVIAHPDDEGAVSPYIARILDEGKRVAVVYGTRGSSGSNQYGPEHAAALGDIREIEARKAWASLGVANVWFLDGNDTASQDVLNSLAHWGHGQALEKMVRIVRLTRPDVVMTFFPGVFIGENHGDHQAAGVIATEAFDLANNPAVFPSQVAGAMYRLEPYLENLRPWQPGKIYYFAYGDHETEYANSGPTYSVKGISKSSHKPYWLLAVEAFESHLTQSATYIDSFKGLTESQLEKKAADDGWSDDQHFVLGKSLVGGNPKDDVFANVGQPGNKSGDEKFTLALGGPWDFYDHFWQAHGLGQMPRIEVPEIAVEAGKTLEIPLVMENSTKQTEEISLAPHLPSGWTLQSGAQRFSIAAGNTITTTLEIAVPSLGSGSTETKPSEVSVDAMFGGQRVGSVRLKVELRKRALPQ